MSGARYGDLSGIEAATLECAECRKNDQLYRDASGVFCRRCGPSVRVVSRISSEAMRRAMESYK